MYITSLISSLTRDVCTPLNTYTTQANLMWLHILSQRSTRMKLLAKTRQSIRTLREHPELRYSPALPDWGIWAPRSNHAAALCFGRSGRTKLDYRHDREDPTTRWRASLSRQVNNTQFCPSVKVDVPCVFAHERDNDKGQLRRIETLMINFIYLGPGALRDRNPSEDDIMELDCTDQANH